MKNVCLTYRVAHNNKLTDIDLVFPDKQGQQVFNLLHGLHNQEISVAEVKISDTETIPENKIQVIVKTVKVIKSDVLSFNLKKEPHQYKAEEKEDTFTATFDMTKDNLEFIGMLMRVGMNDSIISSIYTKTASAFL